MMLDHHEALVLANQRAGQRQGEVTDGQKAVVARLLPSLKLTKPGDGRVIGILTANSQMTLEAARTDLNKERPAGETYDHQVVLTYARQELIAKHREEKEAEKKAKADAAAAEKIAKGKLVAKDASALRKESEALLEALLPPPTPPTPQGESDMEVDADGDQPDYGAEASKLADLVAKLKAGEDIEGACDAAAEQLKRRMAAFKASRVEKTDGAPAADTVLWKGTVLLELTTAACTALDAALEDYAKACDWTPIRTPIRAGRPLAAYLPSMIMTVLGCPPVARMLKASATPICDTHPCPDEAYSSVCTMPLSDKSWSGLPPSDLGRAMASIHRLAPAMVSSR